MGQAWEGWQVQTANRPLILPKQGRIEEESWIPDLIAFTPVYVSDFGNATWCHMADGRSFYFGRSAAQTARDVYRFYGYDAEEMRRKYIRASRYSQTPPLVITDRKLAFVPLRVRKAEHRNDGVYGYVSNRHITEANTVRLQRGAKFLHVRLSSQSSLYARMSLSNFRENLRRAEVFQAVLWIRQMSQEEASYLDVF